MRRGPAGTEAEFTALLDEVIALVGYTRDQDVFRAFYASGLAKRLLLNKSASDDMERNMIVKLQKEMGEEFTTGDVMMKDLQLSETCVCASAALTSGWSSRTRPPRPRTPSRSRTASTLPPTSSPSRRGLREFS